MKTKKLNQNASEKVAGGVVQKNEEGWDVLDKDSGAEFKGFKNEQTAKFLDEAWSLIPLEKRNRIDKQKFDSDLIFVKGMTPKSYAEQFMQVY